MAIVTNNVINKNERKNRSSDRMASAFNGEMIEVLKSPTEKLRDRKMAHSKVLGKENGGKEN